MAGGDAGFDVVTGLIDERGDGGFGSAAVARHHGVEHGTVQRQREQRAVGLAGREFEAGAQEGADCFAHLDHQPVVRSAQQRLVEAQVVADIVAALVDSCVHTFIGCAQFGQVGRRGAPGGQPCTGRFQRAPQFLQVAQERLAQTGQGLPRHHFGVEPVPVLGRQHPRADLRPGSRSIPWPPAF